MDYTSPFRGLVSVKQPECFLPLLLIFLTEIFAFSLFLFLFFFLALYLACCICACFDRPAGFWTMSGWHCNPSPSSYFVSSKDLKRMRVVIERNISVPCTVFLPFLVSDPYLCFLRLPHNKLFIVSPLLRVPFRVTQIVLDMMVCQLYVLQVSSPILYLDFSLIDVSRLTVLVFNEDKFIDFCPLRIRLFFT